MPRRQHNPDPAGHRLAWGAGTALLAVHGILFLILVGILIETPHAVEWIAEAAQAEFVGPDEPVITPTQFARPLGEMWVVGAD